MHPLHDYVAKQLAGKLKSKNLVVWYDARSEFAPFIAEVRGGARMSNEPVPVSVGGVATRLAEYAGSLFELRAVVEPHVSGDQPDTVVIYLPGVDHDVKTSVLMELEKAGTTWKPALKQLAKNVLLEKYTLGVVDDMLPFDRKVSYEDLARAVSGKPGSVPPSILKTIFHDASGSGALIAAWLVSDARDAQIVDKEATLELTKLVKAHLGLDLDAEAPLAKLRAITLRYVLAGEFRADLQCAPPPSIESVPAPKTKEDESAIRDIATSLRTKFAADYQKMADRVEAELGLTNVKLQPGALGAIDTFRFEERALLRYAGELIATANFSDALAVVTQREHSFWVSHDEQRGAQWEAMRRMGLLGVIANQVRDAIKGGDHGAAAWLREYTAKDGWYRLDQAQRRLEEWVTKLNEEPDERPLGVVRRVYEDACHAMAEGFTNALASAGWAVPGVLHQTHIFSTIVSQRPKPVAYFLVDAMRFEMGVELADRLPKASEVSVRAAIASLPSITPIGMAALMPAASGSFSIGEQAGKFGAFIDDTFLPDLTSRRKFAASRVPKLVDFSLDELLGLAPSKLGKKLEGAQVVVVRSQEIDHAGEAGFTFHARQTMDAVIDNLVRAIRKLAAAGVEHAVVSADHGHLFFAADRDESMRTDAPGGKTVDLHRRCWIGKGGATPPGCIRVTAADLGYASDLDLVFPAGTGVFKSGGDLAFHHGGPSLQELVIPVVTVRLPRRASNPVFLEAPIRVSDAPTAITNRMITFDVMSLLGATVVPLILREERKAGGLFGIHGAGELDRVAGTVTIPPGSTTTVVLRLTDEEAPAITIVVQDPVTAADLYRSPAPIPVRLGV